MDLSVLVPIYNWDAQPLLQKLLDEIDFSALEERVEVIAIDDCSTDARLRSANAEFVSSKPRPYLKCRSLQENLGRGAIRNLLASEAAGEFLLFLDCDVLPDADDFIRAYLGHAGGRGPDVVCGGVSYEKRVLPGVEFDYHAYLGKKKEVKPAQARNREPWRFILTSNVMVRRSVFQETPFSERFSGYGYEDVEWGARLAEKYAVLHIDNTASHLGLVTKSQAYDKMCKSVRNYLLLRELRPALFASSAVGKLAGVLSFLNRGTLGVLDRSLKRLFLLPGSQNGFAFVAFQLNFAVLLALGLKEGRKKAQGKVPPPLAGGGQGEGEAAMK